MHQILLVSRCDSLLDVFSEEHRPRRRGLKARGDQSLSLTNVRELLPQSLCGR